MEYDEVSSDVQQASDISGMHNFILLVAGPTQTFYSASNEKMDRDPIAQSGSKGYGQKY